MSPTVKANSLMHWYEFLGDVSGAPLLLLIPGVSGQGIEWDDPFCESLVERGFRVIRYDLRDSGLSEYLEHAPAPDANAIGAGDYSSITYSVDDMADDAAALLSELDIDAAHIVDQSLGGMIAQSLAIRYASRALSLTSISSTTGNPNVGQTRKVGVLTDARRSSTDREVVIDAHVETRRAQFGDGFEFDESRVRALVERMHDRAHYLAGRTRHLAAAVVAPDRTEALRRLDLPTLVVHGTDDPIIDISGAYATADAIPDAQALIIHGMGHNMPPAVWPDVANAIEALSVR